jgi:hypothetical protein
MTITRFQRSRFGVGGGAYICRICSRKTRATRDYEGSIELCGHCCALSEIENGISDNGEVDVAAIWPDFA